ncbi:LPS-assembly protein LptD [bacterium]|nr:LPS-assembly protein LptD [bacterium]
MKKYGIAFLTACWAGPVMAAGVDVNASKTIVAPKIEYNVKSQSIQTSGPTEITNASGQRMTLRDTYLTQNAASVSGDDLELWLGQHVYVSADQIVRNTDETVARHALFTACDGCDPFGNAWEITSTTFVHDMSTHMMAFYNPVFWIYGVPALWIPFYEMPDPSVKYKTGLLMPDIKSTNKMGTQINLPIYISISDTHDLTLKLSYLTHENPLFHAEHRLNLAHSEFRTQGSFTHNRDGENRWHIFNNDVIELGEYARASVFLERASDKTYLQKYGFYDAQPYLDSGAKLELFGVSSYAVADMHIFQELRKSSKTYATPSGDILPNIRALHQTDPFFYETYATLSGDVLGISGSDTSNQRLIGMAGITSPWTLWGGNRLTLNLSGRYDIYHFDNTQMIDGDMYSGVRMRFLPSAYAEWGLPLMRSGSKWLQIIEPRARLTWMRQTDRSQFAMNNDSAGTFLSDTTLFSANRYPGLDLWENGTFADYGVRWAAFDGATQKIEVFLGQSYDFTDRDDIDPNSGFNDGLSDYVGRVSYQYQSWLQLANRFRFDQDNLSLRHMETSAYIGSGRTYARLGHIFNARFIDANTMDQDLHEVVVGAGVGLSDRWSVRWNGTYNVTYDTFQQHSGGIFYNHPCYYLSVEYHRDNAVKDDYVGNTTYQFRFGMSIDGKQY